MARNYVAVPPKKNNKRHMYKVANQPSIWCQKTIAKKIVGKGGDYIMGLKDNQETLSLAAFTAFSEQEEQVNADKELWEVKLDIISVV